MTEQTAPASALRIALLELQAFWTARRAELRSEAHNLWTRRDMLIDEKILTGDKDLNGEIEQLAIAAEIVDRYAGLAYKNAYRPLGAATMVGNAQS